MNVYCRRLQVCAYCRGSKVCNSTSGTMHRVLLHEDIDLTEMANLAKVQEEAKSNAYLSWSSKSVIKP
jgi:hypothetical protein